MSIQIWTLIVTAFGAILGFIGQWLVNNQIRKNDNFQNRFKNFTEFVGITNRLIRATQMHTKNVKLLEELELKKQAVEVFLQKEKNALIAVSKIPNSGLEKVLEGLETKSVDQSFGVSKSVEDILFREQISIDPSLSFIVEKLEEHQKTFSEYHNEIEALSSSAISVSQEMQSIKIQLDMTLATIQLIGSAEIATACRIMLEKIHSWEKGEVQYQEIMDGFSRLITKMNHELHSNKMKLIIRRIFRSKSKFEKQISLPNI